MKEIKDIIEKTTNCFLQGLLVGAATIWLLSCSGNCHAQTRAEVLQEIKRQNIPHPAIVLAQARLETGNFKSDYYRRTRNLFGIKKEGKYAIYRNWRDGVMDYKRLVSSRYDGGSYYSFLRRINYASDPNYIEKLKEIQGYH